MGEGLRVTLEGDRGDIGAAAAHAALGCALQLVTDASSVLGVTVGRWNVSELSLGSMTLVIDNAAAPGVATLVTAGFEVLSNRAVVPAQWTQRMVRKARDLGRLAGTQGVHRVTVGLDGLGVTRVDGVATSHAEKALQASEVALGGVVGVVDRWQERKGREVGLTLDDGSTLTATYPTELGSRIVHDSIGQRVEAWGEVQRNAAGQRISFRIHDFTVAPATLPAGIELLAGLYRDLGASGVTAGQVLEGRE